MISLKEESKSKQKRKSRSVFTEIERRAWQLPKKLSVSEWADESRYLDDKTSAEPGRWRTERTPYLKGIMDAFTDVLVEQITIKASTQVGKTESLLNMMGYAMDQDPGPSLLVMPRKDDAKTISTDRIKPMVEISPAISRHLTGYDDDLSNFSISIDRMTLYMAWSQSPASLAGKPIRYLYLDEINKYPPFSGKEADPIKLSTERTRTFWNRKIVKVSTPTIEEGYISREYERSDQCKYYVPCHHCGKYQVLVFPQIKFPKGERNPETIKSKRLAWYECVGCKKAITDAMKQSMMIKGEWLPEGCSIDNEGKIKGKKNYTAHRGFWINALYSPWLTFSEIAAEFLSVKGRSELLMNFVNSWLAEEWKEKIEERDPDKLKKLALEYPAGTVPDGVIVLTAGIDVQLDHFYYVVRGWGVGYESWKIESALVESWEDVFLMFNKYYPSEVPGIEPFQVHLACVDTGYKTTEVYDICRDWVGLARAIKGKQELGGMLYKMNNLDKYPSGKNMPGGLKLYNLDVTLFKDKVSRFINTGLAGTSKWHLPRDPSRMYLKQMCAEGKVIERDKTGRGREVWKKLSSHAANNFWDCEIYAAAAAEMLRVYALCEDDKPKPIASDVQKKTKKGGSWVKKQGNWLNRG
ncbi:MAG: phage terminase large subunit family protein [Candidatus Aminicenantes bacterium]|nr:phage terminase large subunit family protein [Candidatus Aminicenantes bacterium]